MRVVKYEWKQERALGSCKIMRLFSLNMIDVLIKLYSIVL
jgi:hypothetical protein